MAPNCEKHPLHRGTYIVYDARGYAFRCMASKQQARVWYGVPSHIAKAHDGRSFTATTLRNLAADIGKSILV